MNRTLRTHRVVCATIGFVLIAVEVKAQQPIPVHDLGPVTATTTAPLGVVMGVRQFDNGRVLVNDLGNRRLLLFDSTLAAYTVSADTTGVAPIHYGRNASNLVPFTGDSVLFVDLASQSLLLLDNNGKQVRILAPPKPSDMYRIYANSSGTDARGRLVYRGVLSSPPRVPDAPPPAPIDSAPIVRADFDTRRVDTVAMLGRPGDAPTLQRVRGVDGKVSFRLVLNPTAGIDDWTMNVDGAIAILRAHDYHIDWVNPDGKRWSSPPMPFDWRRLSDVDKEKLRDSVRKFLASFDPEGRGVPLSEARSQGVLEEQLRVVVSADGSKNVPVAYDAVPLSEIADYLPPIRGGALRSDLDGNIWILPHTSAQSRKGGLVYDLVNRQGVLCERIELPAGRSIAGFGRGGIVYLMSGDRANGFSLERAKVR